MGIGYFHTSKEGHPVQVQKLKFLDYKWAKKFSVEDVEEFFYLLNERVLTILFPTCSAKYKKTIGTIVTILDLEDTGLMKIFSKVNEYKIT